MVNPKVFGGILLVVGTSIGAGMLALPLALSQIGFFYSVFLLILCWMVMYLGARFILEVNLQSPPGAHLVSMAQQLLGRPGKWVAWITCLALLYSLLAGYISGGSDVLKGILSQLHLSLPDWVGTMLFTGIFGMVVYSGIQTVDYVNRGLMSGKLIIYVLLVLIMLPGVHLGEMKGGSTQTIPSSLMILMTSFGFASIVPSLRHYFNNDAKVLRFLLLWGSLIPLICYILWNGVMMGVIPRGGQDGLIAISHRVYPITGLIQSLEHQVGGGWFNRCFSLFTAICMLTAFLGVSLSLFDFMADGLSLEKKGKQGFVLYLVTFLPPMLMVLMWPGMYLSALRYAGRCCVILLLLLPACMAWKLYHKAPNDFSVFGGRVSIVGAVIVAFILLYLGG